MSKYCVEEFRDALDFMMSNFRKRLFRTILATNREYTKTDSMIAEFLTVALANGGKCQLSKYNKILLIYKIEVRFNIFPPYPPYILEGTQSGFTDDDLQAVDGLIEDLPNFLTQLFGIQ